MSRACTLACRCTACMPAVYEAALQSRVWVCAMSSARMHAGWELTGSHTWDDQAHCLTAEHSWMPCKSVKLLHQHCKNQDLESLQRSESTICISSPADGHWLL